MHTDKTDTHVCAHAHTHAHTNFMKTRYVSACSRDMQGLIFLIFSPDGVVIFTIPASPLPIEFVATTENV